MPRAHINALGTIAEVTGSSLHLLAGKILPVLTGELVRTDVLAKADDLAMIGTGENTPCVGFTIVVADALLLLRKDADGDGVYGEVSKDEWDFTAINRCTNWTSASRPRSGQVQYTVAAGAESPGSWSTFLGALEAGKSRSARRG